MNIFSRRDKEYIRLPGSRVNWLGENSLWLAKDHLLYIRVRGFKEYYKRFYYNDIECIVIQKTRYSAILSSIYIVFGITVVLASLYVEDADKIVFYIAGSLFFLLSLFNHLRGPSCICFLSTAVQEEKLLSLNRFRIAQKVVKRLRYHIENVQGNLTSEMLQDKMAE